MFFRLPNVLEGVVRQIQRRATRCCRDPEGGSAVAGAACASEPTGPFVREVGGAAFAARLVGRADSAARISPSIWMSAARCLVRRSRRGSVS